MCLFTSDLLYAMENTDTNPSAGLELLLAYIGKSIPEGRRKNNVSQNELAQKTAIELYRIQQIELEKVDFKMLELETIARVLRTEIKAFFP